MAVGTSPGLIYTSCDTGTSWTANSAPAENWWTIATSADGTKLTAGVWNGGVYTLQVTPTPSLNIALANNDLTLSWLVPSTNFLLEQSSDLSNWMGLSNAPALNLTNLHDEVVVPITAGHGFYRLKNP
jgi:hypothetical protein